MKHFACLVAAVVICIAVWKLLDHANTLVSGRSAPTTPTAKTCPPEAWPPLDPKIEATLARERTKSPAAFKDAIDKYSSAQWLKDPWLANYQVDYAIMISMKDPMQATRVVSEVRSRIPTNSPVYPRVMGLKI